MLYYRPYTHKYSCWVSLRPKAWKNLCISLRSEMFCFLEAVYTCYIQSSMVAFKHDCNLSSPCTFYFKYSVRWLSRFLMRWRWTRKSIQLSGLVLVPYHFTITPFFLIRATEREKIFHGQLRSNTGDGKHSNENGCT